MVGLLLLASGIILGILVLLANKPPPSQPTTTAPVFQPNTTEPKAKLTKDNTLGMKFVPLPKGTFYMGGGGGKVGTKTEIKEDFEIAVYPVTQGQWQELMGDNPSYFSSKGGGAYQVRDFPDEDLKQFPVESVSWDDAQKFIKKLNEKERGSGWLYRLPREAEWEYACREGATSEEECSYHFYFDKPTNELTSKLANFGSNVNHPTKAGSYPPNKLGLYDMHGNVWQWCDDLYAEGGSYRVNRGGSLGGSAANCRAASRYGDEPARSYNSLGFRLARVPSR